jgi:hypothetical protein
MSSSKRVIMCAGSTPNAGLEAGESPSQQRACPVEILSISVPFNGKILKGNLGTPPLHALAQDLPRQPVNVFCSHRMYQLHGSPPYKHLFLLGSIAVAQHELSPLNLFS